MELVIEKKQIKDWLRELRKKDAVIDVRKSVLPPKKYFFPVREKIFVLDRKRGKLVSSEPKTKKMILFGLSLADLEAMTQLDEIMEKPQQDFFYWQKRKKTTLIGLSDEPIGIPPGGDLILEKINQNQYRLFILTKKGRSVVKSRFFKKIAKPRIIKYPTKEKSFKKLLLDSEFLAEAVEWSWKGKPEIWEKLKRKCLGCGICTYVCPLCHCFLIEDKVSLDDNESSRCRQWDACTLPRFAQIAGGHNFHPTIKERYYNWYYHKFVRAYREYGKSQCVACGRCWNYCPAKIDIREVLSEIIEGYQKKHR